jgi:hypothetical protein
MFAMDVQWLAISLGSTAVGFVAMLVFACARAAGLADRHLEDLAGQFELLRDRHEDHRRVSRSRMGLSSMRRASIHGKARASRHLRSTAKKYGHSRRNWRSRKRLHPSVA